MTRMMVINKSEHNLNFYLIGAEYFNRSKFKETIILHRLVTNCTPLWQNLFIAQDQVSRQPPRYLIMMPCLAKSPVLMTHGLLVDSLKDRELIETALIIAACGTIVGIK